MRCSVCGREAEGSSVAYVRGTISVCRTCFPNFYVKSLCVHVKRRLLGETPPACSLCSFKAACDRYVGSVTESLRRL